MRHVRRDLAGARLETPHEGLLTALLADGLTPGRASTTLTHYLADLPEPASLPDGWTWRGSGWDDDLAEALTAAHGPQHPDGAWQPDDTAAVRGMFERNDLVPALADATARVAGPDGRSAGHVLAAGPVPWTERPCGWVLNLGLHPNAQGRGLGRPLLDRALHGTRGGSAEPGPVDRGRRTGPPDVRRSRLPRPRARPHRPTASLTQRRDRSHKPKAYRGTVRRSRTVLVPAGRRRGHVSGDQDRHQLGGRC